MGNLYIVATPIGNLDDITFRAVEILKNVDFIACEDTRITKRLVQHYKINTKLISYHQHSKLIQIDYIIELLKSGNDMALVSDAGTPAISDPGGKLVEQAYKKNISVIPIPGPSAITTLLSASGLPSNRFEFLGFLPHKKGRKKLFTKILESKETIIFYESVHRIMKTLRFLDEILNEDRVVIVGRELTKYYEEIRRGTAHEVFIYFENNPRNIKGEFVIATGA